MLERILLRFSIAILMRTQFCDLKTLAIGRGGHGDLKHSGLTPSMLTFSTDLPTGMGPAPQWESSMFVLVY